MLEIDEEPSFSSELRPVTSMLPAYLGSGLNQCYSNGLSGGGKGFSRCPTGSTRPETDSPSPPETGSRSDVRPHCHAHRSRALPWRQITYRGWGLNAGLRLAFLEIPNQIGNEPMVSDRIAVDTAGRQTPPSPFWCTPAVIPLPFEAPSVSSAEAIATALTFAEFDEATHRDSYSNLVLLQL